MSIPRNHYSNQGDSPAHINTSTGVTNTYTGVTNALQEDINKIHQGIYVNFFKAFEGTIDGLPKGANICIQMPVSHSEEMKDTFSKILATT